MFPALANRNYRLFLAGQLVSQSGIWVQRIAQSWLVLELTESPVALGTVTALQYLPILLFSLFAGTLADRYPKRRVLAAIQAAAMLQALALALLVASGQVQLWHVYVLAFVQGTTSALEQPIRHAFPSELVGRDLLANAVALNSAVFSTGRVFGPAVGGFVVAWLGLEAAFLLNGASYLAVLAVLALMRLDGLVRPDPAGRGGLFAQLGEAFGYAARTPPIVFTLGVLTCLAIFGFNYSTFLPLLARYQLGLGASGFGLLSAALGSGSLVGALAVARWGRASARRLVGAGIAFSALLAGVGLSPWFALSLALLAALGMAGVVFTTTANTSLQLGVPEAMRGRIMGLYSLLLAGMTPPGATFTGALADSAGIGATLEVEALVCLAGTALGLGYQARRRSGSPRRHGDTEFS
ncbi:MAG: MFS transporter [Chloroflexi bacterium]|nr:MFS transporter [Chloroflexota bacterium]